MSTIVTIIVGYILVSLLAAWCFGRFGRTCDESALRLLRENQNVDPDKSSTAQSASRKRARSSADRDRPRNVPADTVSIRNSELPTPPATPTVSRSVERLGR